MNSHSKSSFIPLVAISIFSIFGVFLAVSQTAEATSYYVDATGGSDSNTGLVGDAWQTISKVNAASFSAGDNIYFNRGEIWRERLVVPTSGTSDNQITFGAYGTGTKPTIYGSDNLDGSWTQHAGNIYKITLVTTPCGGYGCVVLNGTTNLTTNEGNFGTLSLNEADWESGELYVNIGGDPTGGNIEAGQRPEPFAIDAKNYITVENLILRNGISSGLDIDNACTGIIVNNVDVYSTGNDGFKQWNDSSVTYNNVTSQYNLDDGMSLHSDDGLTSTAVINTGTFSNNANGINNIATSVTTMNDVTASNNTSYGVDMASGTTNILDGSTFVDNTTANARFTSSVSTDITDTAFTGSLIGISSNGSVTTIGSTTVTDANSGIVLYNGSTVDISDSTVITGSTVYGIKLDATASGTYTITDTTISDGAGGINFAANSGGTTTLTNVTMTGQSARSVYLGTITGTATIRNSTITGSGTASLYISGDTLTVENSTISNTAAHAIDIRTAGVLNVNNSVFYGGASGKYAVLVRTGGSVTAINNIFYNNANALYVQDTTVLYNNIFHTNTIAVKFASTGNTSDLTLSHNDFYNNGDIFVTGDGSEENTNGLTSDPQFTDAPGYDFTIPSTPPVIDAGIDADVNTDRLGYSRYDAPNVANTGSVGSYTKDYVDMGAYEYMTSPTVSTASAVQKTDGTGSVDISVIFDDTDDDNTLKAKVEYKAGATCASGNSDPTLDETDGNTTATYGDPKVENDNTYQIGNASGWVTTSSGANTVLFDWLSATDVPTANGQYCISITPNDGAGADGTAVTTTLTLDNVDPSAFSSFTVLATTTTSIALTWTVSSDENFNHYEIWYGNSQSDVSSRGGVAQELDNTDESSFASVSTNAVTISSLTPGTTYYFKIWAVDDYGNETASSGTLSGATNGIGSYFINYSRGSSGGTSGVSTSDVEEEIESGGTDDTEASVDSSSVSDEFENLTVDSFIDLQDELLSDSQLKALEFVLSNDLFSGENINGEKVFGLYENINRAMAATIIARYLGCYDDGKKSYSDLFDDVPDDAWFTQSVGCLKEKGIVHGKTPQLFAPGDYVTNAEFLKMLVEAYMYKNLETRDLWESQMSLVKNIFVDVLDSDWFLLYVNFAYVEDLFDEGKTYFEPGVFLTRNDVVSTMYDFLSTE